MNAAKLRVAGDGEARYSQRETFASLNVIRGGTAERTLRPCVDEEFFVFVRRCESSIVNGPLSTLKGGLYENSNQLHFLETGASSFAPPRWQTNHYVELVS